MTRSLFSLTRPPVFLFVLCILLWNAGLTTAFAEPMRIVYGFDREFAPFSYEEAGGKPVGFDIELVQGIFANTDTVLSMRPLTWERIPLELSAGTITITSGMVRTEQRARLYLFSSKPTFPILIRLFTKIYSRVPTNAYLRGQTVSVEQGSYQHRVLEHFGGINIKPYKDHVAGLRALYNDDVAAYCGLTQNTYYLINKLQYGAITTVGTPLAATEVYIAIARDRGDVQRMVDEGMARFVQSGDYNRLYRKWFVRELAVEEQTALRKAAVLAATISYAPYSNKSFGAAVLTATGKIYTASTVENADPSLNISALQSAVARAVSEGDFELRAASLITPEGDLALPTPEDMQVLHEFGRGVLVLLEPKKGHYETPMIAELLPNPVVRQTPSLNLD